MIKFKRFALARRSLMGKILFPVNAISFLFIFALCSIMVFQTQKSVESAMKSKADGMAEFLQAVGKNYVTNYDIGALENFAKVVANDSDFAFVVYLDKDGRPMTESSTQSSDEKISKVERDIRNAQGNLIGRVVVGYKRERITDALKNSIILGIVSLLATVIGLSLAIWAITRGIVRPLDDSLRRLSTTTQILSSTSGDVSKFSEALQSGVNQQAEVVQETTAAMSEMSSMLAQTSNYAKQSESVMTAVTQKANNGMSVMNQMVEAMTSVQMANEQLQQMSEIIQEIGNKTTVINDIVFKTQLLSFNASIEAARAGQHGRGFAVVAEEVGNLAKMSGNAAQEITALLQDSEKQVAEIVRNTSERVTIGQSVTQQALKNFKEIAMDINLISNQVGNISSAAREQELGVAQTNQAMSELNKTTDLNNQIAQRAHTTSNILSSEVQSLTEISISIEGSLNGKKENSFDQESGPKSSHSRHSRNDHTQHTNSRDKTDTETTSSTPSEVGQSAQDPKSDSIADKIVQMAKKQRSDGRPKKTRIG